MEEAVSVCRQYGFTGPVWPVSRSIEFVGDERCFESIAALPEGPDATLVLASPEATNATVAALAKHGAGGVVCYASGYGETGAQGQVLQDALVQAASELAVVGPNCNGLANFLDRLVLWPNPELPYPKSANGVALIAQSGAFLVNLCNAERALPIVFAAGIGNQAVIDVADLIEVLIDDERITAIGLYLESVRDTDALARAAYRAAERAVPIVVLKSGRTPDGHAAAATHTGALLGADELASAFFDKFAMQRVTRVSEFVETLKCVSNHRGAAGNRLAAITMSGGIATLVADAATRAGLTLLAHPPVRSERISRHLPAYLTVANPLDCSPPLSASSGLSMTNQAALEDCFAEVASGEHELVALFIDFPLAHMNQHYLWEPAARAIANVAQRIDKLFAVVSMLANGLPEQIRDELRRAGVVPLQGLDDAMEALGNFAGGGPRRVALLAHNIAELAPPSPPTGGCTLLLDEISSKRRLAQAGLPVIEGTATTAAEAPAVAEQLGFPVVIKAVNETLAHKTIHGGVALNVPDAASLSLALEQIASAVRRSAGLDVDVFLVERMVFESAAEIFIGIKHDRVWGPCMVLGAGGIDVEDSEDQVVMALPAGERDLERAVRQCRVGQRLARLGVPLGRLEETLARVALYATAEASRVVELDINPLFVLPDGEVMVIDALIRIEEDEDGNRT